MKMNLHSKITSMQIRKIKKIKEEAKRLYPVFQKSLFKKEHRTYEEYKLAQLEMQKTFLQGALFALKTFNKN